MEGMKYAAAHGAQCHNARAPWSGAKRGRVGDVTSVQREVLIICFTALQAVGCRVSHIHQRFAGLGLKSGCAHIRKKGPDVDMYTFAC